MLPPGVAGYVRYCPFPAPADLGLARKLVAASATGGAAVTIVGWTDDPTISPRVSRYVADVIRLLGYHVRLRLVSHAALQDRGTASQPSS